MAESKRKGQPSFSLYILLCLFRPCHKHLFKMPQWTKERTGSKIQGGDIKYRLFLGDVLLGKGRDKQVAVGSRGGFGKGCLCVDESGRGAWVRQEEGALPEQDP